MPETSRIRCPLCGGSSELLLKARDRQAPPPRPEWDVRRCLRCRLGWTDPPPDKEQLRQAYPQAYLGDTEKTIREFLSGELQASRSWRNELEKAAWVESRLRGGRILDVGCGDAKFLWALDPSRWRRWGVEMLEPAVKLVSQRIPGLKLIPGSLDSPRLPPRSFDAVTLWHVFEHLPDPRGAMSRIAELLRPGGWLFIAVPNLDSLQARLFQSHWLGLDVPRHLYHYSPSVLRALIEEAGLRVARRRFQSSRANMHHLKHSLISLCEERFSSRLPYYLLKWALFGLNWVEQASGRYGMLLFVARKESQRREEASRGEG